MRKLFACKRKHEEELQDKSDSLTLGGKTISENHNCKRIAITVKSTSSLRDHTKGDQEASKTNITVAGKPSDVPNHMEKLVVRTYATAPANILHNPSQLENEDISRQQKVSNVEEDTSNTILNVGNPVHIHEDTASNKEAEKALYDYFLDDSVCVKEEEFCIHEEENVISSQSPANLPSVSVMTQTEDSSSDPSCVKKFEGVNAGTVTMATQTKKSHIPQSLARLLEDIVSEFSYDEQILASHRVIQVLNDINTGKIS